jgi:hypothetical protein
MRRHGENIGEISAVAAVVAVAMPTRPRIVSRFVAFATKHPTVLQAPDADADAVAVALAT